MRSGYRPEIDGLRAIAVLSVIFFHAGLSGFSGGFVGVDVFFVISGYLITGILLRELRDDSFSILRFYERRMRRILPALFLVLLACLPLGWFLMDPYAYDRLGQGLIATTLFSSNILFWRTTDYFTATVDNPLLHTWSLGVEEQFYIFFPLFLWAVWRYARSWLWELMVVAAILSLALSEWGVQSGRAVAAFYVSPLRAYELLIGALVAHAALKERFPRLGQRGSDIISWVGLGAIIWSIVFFSQETPFPGLYALVPAIGTALILAFGSSDGTLGRFLSQRSMVGIGLISYSAYLWHQPVFSFIHIGGWAPGAITNLGIVLAILGLSWLSWRYVESPFRDRAFIQSRTIFWWSGLMSVAVTVCGAWLTLTHGVSNRYTEKEMEWWKYADISLQSAYVTKRFDGLAGPFASSDARKVLVIGDSYAQDFINMVYEADVWQDAQIRTVYVPTTCQMVYVNQDTSMYISPVDRPGCAKNPNLQSSMGLIEQADVIVLAASWKKWSADLLSQSIDNMNLRVGQRLFVIGPKSFGPIKIRNLISIGPQGRSIFRNPVRAVTVEANEALRANISKDILVDQILIVCGESYSCPVVTDDDRLISYDGGHLTPAGAKHIGQMIFSRSSLADIQ